MMNLYKRMKEQREFECANALGECNQCEVSSENCMQCVFTCTVCNELQSKKNLHTIYKRVKACCNCMPF